MNTAEIPLLQQVLPAILVMQIVVLAGSFFWARRFDRFAKAIWERQDELLYQDKVTAGFFWVPPGRNWWKDNGRRQELVSELFLYRPRWLHEPEMIRDWRAMSMSFVVISFTIILGVAYCIWRFVAVAG